MEQAPAQQKPPLAIRIASVVCTLAGLLLWGVAVYLLVTALFDLKNVMNWIVSILGEAIVLPFGYFLIRAGTRDYKVMDAGALHSLLGLGIFFLLLVIDYGISAGMRFFFPEITMEHIHVLTYLAILGLFLQRSLCRRLYPHVPLTGAEKEKFLRSPSRNTILSCVLIFYLDLLGDLGRWFADHSRLPQDWRGYWDLGSFILPIVVSVVIYKALTKDLRKGSPAPLPPANPSVPSSSDPGPTCQT